MFKFVKDKKAQGALEYILIIGAAVLIAAIVIAVLISSARSAKTDVNESMNTASNQLDDLNHVIAE